MLQNKSNIKHTGRASVLLLLILQGLQGFAQMPETDIWLFKLEKKDSVYHYKDGLNITNRKGYDNQPCFTPDNKKILYVSVCEDSQSDIYQYDLKSHQSHLLTRTPESEYSPQVTPDGQSISCVVVEKDSSQRVWLYDLQGRFKKVLQEATDSVGYYSWLNADTLLYYKLTEPYSLHALDLKTGKDAWLCSKPCRAFKAIPGTHRFIYAVKDSASTHFMTYDPALKKSSDYTTYNSTDEDFIWNPELGLIKSEKSVLLRYNERSKRWETLFSFEGLGVKKITRFMFDSKNKQLVIVSNL